MNKRLRPFFGYFGSKWRLAPRYPAPLYSTIVEPFAGSAGYSLFRPGKKVVLCDSNPIILSIWRYLLAATPEQILALPNDVSSNLSPAEKALIGMWYAKAPTAPREKRTPWVTKYPGSSWWGVKIKRRIAGQLGALTTWSIGASNYTQLSNKVATWFVDPPYQYNGGHTYPNGSDLIDYNHLREWCESRRGQVIICEGPDAEWLPKWERRLVLPPKYTVGGVHSKSPSEFMWVREC
jgi:site-specific DNA-adenine methylase